MMTTIMSRATRRTVVTLNVRSGREQENSSQTNAKNTM